VARLRVCDRYIELAAMKDGKIAAEATLERDEFELYGFEECQFGLNLRHVSAALDAMDAMCVEMMIHQTATFSTETFTAVTEPHSAAFVHDLDRMVQIRVHGGATVDVIGSELKELIRKARAEGAAGVLLWTEGGKTSFHAVSAESEVSNALFELEATLNGHRDRAGTVYSIEHLRQVSEATGKNDRILLHFDSYQPLRAEYRLSCGIEASFVLSPMTITATAIENLAVKEEVNA